MAKLLDRIRIGIVGLGWVGQEVARAALEDPRVRLVGVADVDPMKAKRDLGEIIGEGRLGVPIDPNVEAMLARARPEVAVVCTSSDVEALSPTLEACVAHGAHVVTSCENLADPELALAQLEPGFEQRVRDSGLVVLATGVNPGFAMDRLPVMLTQATRNIRRVRVARVVNASTRRAQLQAKIGVGMTPHDFVESIKRGDIGHAGLSASLRLLAKGLGVTLEKTSEAFTPIIAEAATNSSVLGPVKAGAVRGIYQIARGYRARREVITLELTMALDEPNPRDTIDIVGEPPLHFEGELPGDLCTVATMLSAISVVVTMPPGLRTVLDVPLEQPEEPVAAKEPLIASRTRGATQLPQRGAEGRRLKGATLESKKPRRHEAPVQVAGATKTADPEAKKTAAKAKPAKAKPTKARAKAKVKEKPAEKAKEKPKQTKRAAKGRAKPAATARADAQDAHVASTGAPTNGASEKEHERGAQPARVMTRASVKRERNAHASTNGVTRKKQT